MFASKSRRVAGRIGLVVSLILSSGVVTSPAAGQQTPVVAHQPPPDATWTADAAVEQARSMTDASLGAAQGVAVRDGRIYAYGDVRSATPRVGVIREYDMELKPTGRLVWLRRDGRPLIIHPTGLTWDPKFGTFLGDTVQKKAVLYRLDWERAWQDGHLDHAVRDAIADDAAINGCRPTFVTIDGRRLLATADYGDVRPEIRLCDPEALLKAGRTGAPGVIVHRVLCGPFNQNLHWDESRGQLTCVQNVIEGRGWRLDTLDIARAVADGRADAAGVRVRRLTFAPHDELEGYWPLDGERALFATSSRVGNLTLGSAHAVPPRPSPPGTR